MQKARVLGVSGLLLFAVLIAAGQNNNDSARRALEEARQAAGGDAWSRVGEIVTEGKLQAAWNSGPLRYIEHVATGRNVLHYEFDSGSRETRGTDLTASGSRMRMATFPSFTIFSRREMRSTTVIWRNEHIGSRNLAALLLRYFHPTERNNRGMSALR